MPTLRSHLGAEDIWVPLFRRCVASLPSTYRTSLLFYNVCVGKWEMLCNVHTNSRSFFHASTIGLLTFIQTLISSLLVPNK